MNNYASCRNREESLDILEQTIYSLSECYKIDYPQNVCRYISQCVNENTFPRRTIRGMEEEWHINIFILHRIKGTYKKGLGGIDITSIRREPVHNKHGIALER